MPVESLINQIDQAVGQAVFSDVFRNRIESSTLRHLYEKKQKFAISSTDGISVREQELRSLTSELESLLGYRRSPDTGLVGNGLYKLTGSGASPRLPSVKEYAKILVLAGSRIGAQRVVELLAGWIQGEGIRVLRCVLLKGLQTKGVLRPVDGMHLETMSKNGDDLPRSLRLEPHEHRHEQYVRRALLAIEYETVSGLYEPKVVRERFPPDPVTYRLVNAELSSVSIESFCRAISLETNNQVDWFIGWDDFGDVEAFFLNPGFGSQRKEASNSSIVSVTENEVRQCLRTHELLHEFNALGLGIAGWRNSKRAVSKYEQLIELRIALESVLLSEDKGTGEKRHRLAIRGAWLLGETLKKRKCHYDTLRYVYDYASSVIHGGTPKAKKGRELERDIAQAQELCRKAILQIAQAGMMPDWSAVVLGGKQV